MKFAEINKKYTEKVASYMAMGYTINTATMSGSQGEIAHIDLTNGKEIIRVMLESKSEHEIDREKEKWYSFDVTQIVVGRCTDKVTPNSDDTWQTLWNSHLEIISCEKFYKIGRNGFYGTKEESMNQQKKHIERYRANHIKNEKVFSDSAKEIVLPFMKRQPKCKSIKVSDIENVKKVIYEDEFHVSYFVLAKGNQYRLH